MTPFGTTPAPGPGEAPHPSDPSHDTASGAQPGSAGSPPGSAGAQPGSAGAQPGGPAAPRGPHNPSGASGLDRFFDTLRRSPVRRDTSDTWLGGVCSGLARHVGIDPLLLRVGLIVLIFLGGFGFLAYLAAWALLPALDGTILAEKGVRGGDTWAIILLVVIGIALFGGLGFGAGPDNGWYVVLLLAVVGYVVLHRRRGSGEGATEPAGPAPGAAAGTPDGAATPWSAGDDARRHDGLGAVPPMAPAAATTAGMSPGSGPASGPASAYQASGPHSAGYAGSGRPTAAPAATRTRRRGPGRPLTLLALGLAIVAYAIGFMTGHGVGSSVLTAHLTGAAAGLGVLGLTILVLGLTGRRSALLGFVGMVVAVVTAIAALTPTQVVGSGMGERTWMPTGATTATSTYRLGVGDATLDLSHLTAGAPGAATRDPIIASVSVGELTIIVPDGLEVVVDAEVSAGAIEERNGSGVVQTVEGSPVSLQVGGSGQRSTDVTVQASVRLGQIVIVTED